MENIENFFEFYSVSFLISSFNRTSCCALVIVGDSSCRGLSSTAMVLVGVGALEIPKSLGMGGRSGASCSLVRAVNTLNNTYSIASPIRNSNILELHFSEFDLSLFFGDCRKV